MSSSEEKVESGQYPHVITVEPIDGVVDENIEADSSSDMATTDDLAPHTDLPIACRAVTGIEITGLSLIGLTTDEKVRLLIHLRNAAQLIGRGAIAAGAAPGLVASSRMRIALTSPDDDSRVIDLSDDSGNLRDMLSEQSAHSETDTSNRRTRRRPRCATSPESKDGAPRREHLQYLFAKVVSTEVLDLVHNDDIDTTLQLVFDLYRSLDTPRTPLELKELRINQMIQIVDGLSYNQIAQHTDVTDSAVRLGVKNALENIIQGTTREERDTLVRSIAEERQHEREKIDHIRNQIVSTFPELQDDIADALVAFATQGSLVDLSVKLTASKLDLGRKFFREVYEEVYNNPANSRALAADEWPSLFEQTVAFRIFGRGLNPLEFVKIDAVQSELVALDADIKGVIFSLIEKTLSTYRRLDQFGIIG